MVARGGRAVGIRVCWFVHACVRACVRSRVGVEERRPGVVAARHVFAVAVVLDSSFIIAGLADWISCCSPNEIRETRVISPRD